MINAELLAKIKAEIKRLQATNPSEYNCDNAVGYMWALNDILSFLSTLESENPISHDEELEEEIQSFWNGASGFQPKFATLEVKENGFATIARHFAEWQKEQMMKDAVEGRVSYFESREVAVIYYDDPKGNTMCFFAPSSSLETGDKVRIIIVKD